MGAMTFGDEADEEATHAMLDRFVEAGGTFIDTADVYAKGRSEEFIGRWLASRSHSHLVIATKARFSTSSDPKDRGAGRRHLSRAIEASLKRLGLEAVDLYQIHAWDPEVPAEETLGTLDDLVRQGKVRYRRCVQFHRLAAAAFHPDRPSPRPRPGRLAPGPIQPAGSSHRARVAAAGARGRARPAALVSARAEAGCRASTAATIGPPEPPGWVRIRRGGSKPMTRATPTEPGRSSMR